MEKALEALGVRERMQIAVCGSQLARGDMKPASFSEAFNPEKHKSQIAPNNLLEEADIIITYNTATKALLLLNSNPKLNRAALRDHIAIEKKIFTFIDLVDFNSRGRLNAQHASYAEVSAMELVVVDERDCGHRVDMRDIITAILGLDKSNEELAFHSA